jgi:hypothetical protein
MTPVTTPCAVCAVEAQLKPGSFFASRGLDWPVKEIAGRDVHLACASEVEFLIRTRGELAIDEHGVGRWTTNGSVIPGDCAALLTAFGLADGLDLAAAAAAREVETAAFLERYRAAQPAQASPEEIADMTAAFGPGTKVVDVITGRETQL